MILETGIPKELMKIGYWFKASAHHLFIIELEINDNNVKAKAIEVTEDYLSKDIDCYSIKNGQKVAYFACCNEIDLWLELDIWAKYYYPKFNEDKNQWYHKEDKHDADYILDFSELLKGTYEIAMKESKLQTY